MKKDFGKFLLDRKITSTSQDRYFGEIQKRNSTSLMIDSSGASVDIFSKLLEDRIIFLSTEVDDYVCNIIKAQLLYLESISNDDISIYIDSPGGSIYSGYGLLDVMEYIKPDIVTVNTGLAASMASVILCCGAKGKRKSLKRSRTMIHQPLSYSGYAQASDMEIEAREINNLKTELCQIISDKTGHLYDKVLNDMDRNYWMTSKEAKSYGMIDKILLKR